MLENVFTFDVDIKKQSYTSNVIVTQNDDVTFKINVFDDGVPFDLTNVTRATLANTRVDKRTVISDGTKTGSNEVTFQIGDSETAITGRMDAVVQLYDDSNRISAISFSYEVETDPTAAAYTPLSKEKTLIEVVLSDGPIVIQDAIDATNDVNTLITNTRYNETWTSSTTYQKNNIVSFNGSSYISLIDNNNNNTPPDPLVTYDDGKWALVSRKGTDGIGQLIVKNEFFTATEGQTLFTLLNGTYEIGFGRLQVVIGGVPQYSPTNFSETSNNSFTISGSLPEGTKVTATYFNIS